MTHHYACTPLPLCPSFFFWLAAAGRNTPSISGPNKQTSKRHPLEVSGKLAHLPISADVRHSDDS